MHVAVCGTKTSLERDVMHKVKYLPKIDLHFDHNNQFCLEGGVLQNTFPYGQCGCPRFSCVSIGFASVPMASPSYMSRAYIKNFGNLVLILFDYILVHDRVLKEVHLWFECYVMSLDRAIIAYQFIEHQVGRIVILHFGPIIEHGNGDSPCGHSFQLITYMDFKGTKRFFP